jgi:hypothetical protein
MGRTTDEKGSDKAQAIRRTQQKDRSRILQEINQSQTAIAGYSEERAPLSNELKKTEADVGPIKYIAALLYSETVNADILDKAVRLVILLIIVVFDPLAVLLLIAANMSMSMRKPESPRPVEKPIETTVHDMDIPVFVPKEDSIHVDKDNVTNIVIDEVTGESIPPIGVNKKLKPKYDYSEPFSFKESK